MDAVSDQFDRFADDLARATEQAIAQVATDFADNVRGQARREGLPRKGVKVYLFPTTGYVRFDKRLSDAAIESRIEGEGWLLLLTPEGERLGFPRIRSAQQMAAIEQQVQRQGGSWFVNWERGAVLVSLGGQQFAPYAIARSVRSPQRIQVFEILDDYADKLEEAMRNAI